MRWFLLAAFCVGLCFIPWKAVGSAVRPYWFRVVLGLLFFSAIVFATFHFEALKLL